MFRAGNEQAAQREPQGGGQGFESGLDGRCGHHNHSHSEHGYRERALRRNIPRVVIFEAECCCAPSINLQVFVVKLVDMKMQKIIYDL